MTPFYVLAILAAVREGRDLYLIRTGQLTVSRRPRKPEPKEPTP